MMIVKLTVSVPPVLMAVIVYETADCVAVGVPEITPSLNDIPVGRVGEIDQVATTPPLLVTVTAPTSESLVKI